MGCAIKLLCPPAKEHGETLVRGGAQITPSQVPPRATSPGQWEPKLGTGRKGRPAWPPPAEPQPLGPGVKAPVGGGLCLPGGTGSISGCRGRAFGVCTGLVMGCLREGRKVGKRVDPGDSRTSMGGTGGQKVVRSLQVRTLAWPCSTPRHQHRLTSTLLKCSSTSAPFRALRPLHVHVCGVSAAAGVRARLGGVRV